VVEVLTAMVNGNRALAEMYKTQIDAETAKVEAIACASWPMKRGARLRREGGCVQGEVGRLQQRRQRAARVSKVYESQVQGFKGKVEAYTAGVEAYRAQVQGYTVNR
jgi:hypothetical protein